MTITTIIIKDEVVEESTWTADVAYDFEGASPDEPITTAAMYGVTFYYLLKTGLIDSYTEEALQFIENSATTTYITEDNI